MKLNMFLATYRSSSGG